jgi:hypothetical protein
VIVFVRFCVDVCVIVRLCVCGAFSRHCICVCVCVYVQMVLLFISVRCICVCANIRTYTYIHTPFLGPSQP